MTRTLRTLAVAAAALSATAALAQDRPATVGALYTMNNAAGGNDILIYDRLADGSLRSAGNAPSGGRGTGGGLGNQSALVLSPDHHWLFAVNAGSNQVTSFEVRENGLRRADVVPSGGTRPVSLTAFGNYLYVLNAGSDNIAGFLVTDEGHLLPLASSMQPLSGTGAAPAQIEFSPDGDLLAVTEKATNRIVLYRVDRFGRPSGPIVHEAAGQTPFGFAFGRRHQIFVSEAFGGAPGASVLSSYEVTDEGELRPISRRVATTQTAACWVVLGVEEPFAFVSNTGSNTISTFQVDFDGSLRRIQAEAVETGAGPIDMAMSPGGRFLYVLNSASGSIGDYRVEPDGKLTSIPGSITGLPRGANGLAVR